MASVLWLTSRSAFERGAQFCAFARYTEYHAGPFGYGIQRKAQSLPLVSGIYTHLGITSVLQWLLDARKSTGIQPTEPPDEVIRWGVELATEKYQQVCDKRGILTFAGDDLESLARLQRLIVEQKHLIAGLIWAWCLLRLPAYLREYLIVEVEGEQTYVLDCTCGIGEGIGEIADHEARDCTGIGLQSKPDILGERKSDGKYGYTELKTAGQARRAWNDSWEHKQQFLIGVLGAERRYGVEITHANVEGLIKGQRKRDYPYTDDLPKLQQTSLCYSYFSPGNPPASEGQWRPAFNYRTSEGLKYTAGKKEGYQKTALWDIPTHLAFPGLPEGMTVSEYWTKVLYQDYPYHLEKCVSFIGPIPKQRQQIDKALRSLVAEEKMWQDRLWKIYEFNQKTGKQWGDDEFMEFVETVVPRSWNCDPFGPDHPCSHQYICHPVTDEWRDPFGSGLAVPRIPHHEPEKQQVIARGLVPEDTDGWVDEDDAGDDGDDYGD